MSVSLSPLAGAGWQFFDDNGVPLNGGLLYTYAAGTTTPTATYTSDNGVTANANPIVLDSAGRTPSEVWLTNGTTYKIAIYTSTNVLIRTWDDIAGVNDLSALAASNGSALVGFIQAGTGAVTRTAQAKMRDVVSVKDFGAVGNNSTDDTVAIQAAVNSMSNGSTLSFVGNATYRVTAPIVIPPNLTGCVFLGNGATIRANHNGDGLVMIATNQNFSRHKVYDLTIQGPNVSFPNNSAELAGTSTGAALKMGYNDTSNTVAGYLTSFYNCTFTNFYQGVYLQSTILVNFYSGYISFNQFGVYVDGGQTNANTFFGVGIRENRQFGVYSSGRTGGSLSNATHNVFHGCEIETNIPYNLSAGGYPVVFDPSVGIAIKLWNSYDWIFDSCYLENHNYSVVIDGSSDDNQFKSCRFDGGGASGVRPGSVVIGGTSCNNNMFVDCKMVDYIGYAEGTFQNLSSTNQLNQLIDCVGFSFNSAYILNWPNIQNLRKAQGTAGNGQSFGAVVIPDQGILSNPSSGTSQGQINGIGTGTATLNAFGYSHFVLGNQITGNTTITAISNMRPGQTLIITNYQVAYTVTIASASVGTGAIVLDGLTSVALNQYGQTIELFCNQLGQIVEVGKNFTVEGLFTPTIEGTGTLGSAIYASSNGKYTRVGKRVFFELVVDWSAGTGTGNLRIGGLPFTSSATATFPAASIGIIENVALTAGTYPTAFVRTNSTQISLRQSPTGGGGSTDVAYDAAGFISLSGNYAI